VEIRGEVGERSGGRMDRTAYHQITEEGEGDGGWVSLAGSKQ
jgi:hypothetical protein